MLMLFILRRLDPNLDCVPRLLSFPVTWRGKVSVRLINRGALDPMGYECLLGAKTIQNSGKTFIFQEVFLVASRTRRANI
jgi:hypothetical protein